jgi:virginiamycin B lyase
MRKQLLAFLSRDLSNGFLWLRGRRRRKLSFHLRSLQRSLTKVLIVAGLLLTWVAPSAKAGSIYWASGNNIGRANLDGTGVKHDFITGINNLNGIAVDGTYIYWSSGSGGIGRANLDGTGVNETFITGVSTEALAVDGTYIYWAWEGDIGRANLDGTGANQTFITPGENSSFLEGVAVDGTYIYWTNNDFAPIGAIGRANLDGTGVNKNFIPGDV